MNPPQTGKHIVEDWEFHYSGWEQEESIDPNQTARHGREGTTSEDMFLASRKGQLDDGELLEKLGITKERMTRGDVLFFHQLLILQMCDPKWTSIVGDPQKPL